MTAKPSRERRDAIATYAAEFQTIGEHTRLDVAIGGDQILKPSEDGALATHLKIQALTQNIRYRIDGGEASATVGFQLTAGSETTLPVPNNGVSVFEEAAGAIVQYQWLR